jgi:hypothetical protein
MTAYQKVFTMSFMMKKNRLAAARIRIRYLYERFLEYDILDCPLANLYAKECLDEIIWIMQNVPQQEQRIESSITDEQIILAREYPIERLIDFKNGKAIAWCHKDKRPSLSWNKRDNKAMCWPCNRQFNPIDVLVERDGYSFINAVKELM